MDSGTSFKKHLDRISNMFGSDPGFYVVAIHSFIESIANRHCCFFEESSYSFREKLEELRALLLKSNPGIRKDREVFNKIINEHRITNRVRHNFETLSKNEAAAATHNLITLCRAGNFADERDFDKILKNTDLWDRNKSLLETDDELRKIRIKLQLKNLETSALNKKLSEYRDSKQKLIEAEKILKKTKAEYNQLKNTSEHRKDKNEELRHKLRKLEDKLSLQEKDAVKAENLISEYAGTVEEYISYNERLTHYSRTRRDYETSIIKLTVEQQNVVDNISLERDFLIKGSAGTGKTLVLLKAIEKLHKNSSSQLDFSNEKRRDILLTYTGTLVKYNYYISTILEENLAKDDIQTADSYLNNIFTALTEGSHVSYSILKTLIEENNTVDFLSSEELFTELEDFLFANNITEHEYTGIMIARRGLKKPLNQEQRKKVWKIRKKIISEMDKKNIYSKGASRCRLLEAFKDRSVYEKFRVNHVFIDESQDLSSCEISILKKLAKESLIMAGDSSQTIYGFSSPYARAGMLLAGKTKTLRLNYRNTSSIHKLSEIYKNLSPVKLDSDAGSNIAFREGPVPELLKAYSADEMDDFLITKTDFFYRKNRL